MRVKKLRAIQEVLMKRPAKFDINTWADKSECGTTCCIGGQALVNEGYLVRFTVDDLRNDNYVSFSKPGSSRKITEANIQSSAARILGITDEQAARLFHVARWPNMFNRIYINAITPQAKAAVAVAVIEHFIQTNGNMEPYGI